MLKTVSQDSGGSNRGLGIAENILRRMYLDYRSRQITGLLIYLSQDEVYRKVGRRFVSGAARGRLTYDGLVELTTDWLNGWVPLPPFHVWLEDYQANPLPYESYFLGLWRAAEEPERN